jgi:hypothetical protein
MAALCARGRAKSSPLHCLSAALLLIALAGPALAAPPPPSEPIVVVLDQATILQLPERASTVVVGNPLIADLTIQPGGLAVVTGKGYGATNFIVLDKAGAVLLEKIVEVTIPNDDTTVVVYRGAERETYSCTPDCSRRLTLGDNPEVFDKTLAQITTRNSQATAAGALNSGH